MNTKKIAIARRGGGSRCVFVAAALEKLIAPNVQNHRDDAGRIRAGRPA
jgi:predicted patatin/cPLA2 family phospholipase